MKFTPFREKEIKIVLDKSNSQKLLTQEIDEMLLEPLIEFLEEPIAK